MARGRSRREVLALACIFVFAILAWGLSMWTLKKRLSGPLLDMVQDQGRLKTLKPWLDRARSEACSYELAASSPSLSGKPVLWKVLGVTPKTAWESGLPERPLAWANPDAVQADRSVPKKGLFWALGVVEKGGREPTLRYLGAPLLEDPK